VSRIVTRFSVIMSRFSLCSQNLPNQIFPIVSRFGHRNTISWQKLPQNFLFQWWHDFQKSWHDFTFFIFFSIFLLFMLSKLAMNSKISWNYTKNYVMTRCHQKRQSLWIRYSTYHFITCNDLVHLPNPHITMYDSIQARTFSVTLRQTFSFYPHPYIPFSLILRKIINLKKHSKVSNLSFSTTFFLLNTFFKNYCRIWDLDC